MNALENWFCSTSYWRRRTEQRLLPWLLADAALGEHLLEIGAGPGAATRELSRRAPRVTSLEYDHRSAATLARHISGSANVVQGDASALPFADNIFSSAVAILMFHHLRSTQLQDRAFGEIRRVLQPGGRLFIAEIPDGWLHRLMHFKSTFVPLREATVGDRLASAGFTGVTLDFQFGGFRVRASRRS